MDDIRQVLLNDWDPLNVGELSTCADEYDCCIGGIYRLLVTRSTAEEIAEHLAEREKDHFGYEGVTAETLLPVARKLTEINVNLDKLV